MAVSGTVPAAAPRRVDPLRLARLVRRVSLVGGVVLGTWFLLQFGSRWVPAGMDTVPSIPPGSWCIVDRWAVGLAVGSDVFVATPRGELLSRVASLNGDQVVVENPNPGSRWPDRRTFGPLPRRAVRATVLVVFRLDEAPSGDRRGR